MGIGVVAVGTVEGSLEAGRVRPDAIRERVGDGEIVPEEEAAVRRGDDVREVRAVRPLLAGGLAVDFHVVGCFQRFGQVEEDRLRADGLHQSDRAALARHEAVVRVFPAVLGPRRAHRHIRCHRLRRDGGVAEVGQGPCHGVLGGQREAHGRAEVGGRNVSRHRYHAELAVHDHGQLVAEHLDSRDLLLELRDHGAAAFVVDLADLRGRDVFGFEIPELPVDAEVPSGRGRRSLLAPAVPRRRLPGLPRP
jgi:hypothetical protein